jgi:hypothetical protein
MKKALIVITATLLLGIFNGRSQGTLNVGLSFSMPIEETRTVSKMGFGIESSYMFELSDTFDLGASIGLSYFNIEGAEGTVFLPLAASASFLASKDFSIITDIGYAVGINKGNKGGYYYKPKLNYFLNDNFNFNVFYSGITRFEGSQWTSIGAGITYVFHKD